MKKIIHTGFVLASLLSCAVAGEAVIQLGQGNGELGSNNNIIRVYMKNDVPISALQLAIADIPDFLTPDSVWSVDRAQPFTVSSNDDTTGAFNIIVFSLDPTAVIPADSGAILNISYTVNPGADRFPFLDLVFFVPPTLYSREFGKIPVKTVSGKFLVGNTAVNSRVDLMPSEYALEQNFPNPFNPTTRIGFELPRQERAQLEIFNVLGQRIRTLVNEELRAGIHEVIWDGLDENGEQVAGGVYLYRLRAGNFMEYKRMAFMR